MKKIFVVLLLIGKTGFAQTQLPDLVPMPVSVKTHKGNFILSKKTVIAARDEKDRETAKVFNSFLKQLVGFELDIDRQETKNYIRLNTKKFIQAPENDAYNLEVTDKGVTIDGDTYAGTFYGLQTLLQLIPVNSESRNPPASVLIPLVSINDFPRFQYRGMHLDVCRHFFPISYIKRYIDILAFHKLNYFHWHLTDDQGWRIEIKKYPGLTKTAAHRNGTIIGRYPGTGNDNLPYGGYYTQDDVREIVEYANSRHITVIPEIEMPGHSSAAIAAYPWLSCFPEQETNIPSHPSLASQQMKGKKVQETWGVFEDVFCAGNDSTFQFLQDVMDEVIPLFPSNYVHVGGDESPKANWKKCPKCQARIKTLGLKNEHELQSYFVQRMEKYINAKGKTIIGWDEILEGGLAPNAIVMSWRGEKGGVDAAKQGHKVIMTPQKPVYFDHSQTRTEDSLVIGGYNPLEAVYAYDPVPKELDSSQAKFILGGQANLWTEYIAYPSKIEYMVLPRMGALSEVLWSQKSSKDWASFEKRLQTQFRRYERLNLNASKAYFDVAVSLQPNAKNNGLKLVIKPRDNKGVIRYSYGSAIGQQYSKPVVLTRTDSVIIQYYRSGNLVNKVVLNTVFNKATGKTIKLGYQPNEKYPGQGGSFSLINGIFSNKGLSYPDWLGWIGDDMEANIDLGAKTSFDSVRVHTLNQNGSWIYLPKDVEVFVSQDGKSYKSVGSSSTFVKEALTMGWITVQVPKTSARFIRVVAHNYGTIPDGLPGGGTKAWLFADEIQVY